jgi:F0F1-type ATP synthase membrane subunit c/vacuolar-type H+-ATPase subunit K
MSNNSDSSRQITRRAALTSTALALGVAAAGTAVTSAIAQQKITQAAAKYQDQPKGPQSCAVCANFQPPNACKFVQGTISPTGWCLLFAPKA